jgi:peptide/nickel transport system substrate-binding protein
VNPRITRRGVLAGGLTVGAAGALAGCGSAPADVAGTVRETLVEAVAAMPGGLAFDSKPGGYEAFEYTLLTGAGLIRNPYVQADDDPNGLTQDLYSFEGVLAEGYDVSADGLTYTFHLRRGVVSQHGNPFTADDVLYSYERKWNSTSIAPAISLPALTDAGEQLTKVDDFTVQFTVALAGHGFPLLAVLSKISGEIYDSTLLKQMATDADPYAVEWSNLNGNFGFGPYLMEDYQAGQQISYVANPDYVLGEPPIRRIVQRVVPDAGVRATLVRNGDVDVAVQLRPADVADLSSDPAVTTFRTDTNNFLWTFHNTAAKPLDDVRVRQAFFKAVPYQQIIDQVYHGRANPVVGLLNPDAPGYDGSGLDEQVYDPEGSKALLAQAGYTDLVPLELIVSNAVPDLEEAAVQMQTFGRAAGFDISIDVVPGTVQTERVSKGNYQVQLQRDMAVSFESPPYALLLAFPEDNPGRNTTHWEDERYYAAVDAGSKAGDALSDAAGQFWHAAELVWQEDRPQIQVAKVQPLHVFHRGVKGFAHRTDNVLDFSIMTTEEN